MQSLLSDDLNKTVHLDYFVIKTSDNVDEKVSCLLDNSCMSDFVK